MQGTVHLKVLFIWSETGLTETELRERRQPAMSSGHEAIITVL